VLGGRRSTVGQVNSLEPGQTEVAVVAGMSGAGRSSVANALEDLGWWVIDNLPPSLIPSVADLAAAPGSAINRLALVVGTHGYHEDLMPALASLRASGIRVRVIFLDASTDALLRRYDDTRRRHPLGEEAESIIEAIESERALLEPVRGEADMLIDTTESNVHQLKARIADSFTEAGSDSLMRTSVMSFGYKHGVPSDADLVFDCRFLPNPHWVEELRPYSGMDARVRSFVLEKQATNDFLHRLMPMIDMLLPAYLREGKSYLSIAFGCTGGRHRSVAISEEVARLLRARGFEIRTRHRDIEK
jgi:RNase adapter protein RapZ